MAWFPQYPNLGNLDLADIRRQSEKAMSLPVGLAFPLWIGAAAGAGVALWWMSRWAQPSNLEAFLPRSVTPASLEPEPALATPASEKIETSVVAGQSEPAPIAESVLTILPPIDPEPMVERVVVVPAAPDDLTRLVGIGPRIADALVARGVTSFRQLAAWSRDDAAAFDAAMNLKGRAVRSDWIGQAQRLAAEI